MSSKIEWTEETLNPLIGCSKQSDGCKNCYAIIQANIRQANPNPKIAKKFEGTVKREVGASGEIKLNWTGRINFDEETLLKPLKWKNPRKIFVNSMSDLFHKNVPDEWIDKFYAVAALTPQHTYQVLTKNAERMREYMRLPQRANLIGMEMALPIIKLGLKVKEPLAGFPFPNVWHGVSVENRKEKHRIDDLRKTPAAIRFLSCEPLLEDLGELDLTGIHWVIVGGESGNKARPCDISWIRSIVRQCQSANVPVFVKQLGSGRRENAKARIQPDSTIKNQQAAAI